MSSVALPEAATRGVAWPIPPYLDAGRVPADSPCLVELMDGEVDAGHAMRPLPDGSGLLLGEPGTQRREEWSRIRYIRALWCLPLRAASENSPAPGDRRLSRRAIAYRLEWTDGRLTGGMTRGYFADGEILYLYVCGDDASVGSTPWAVPRRALRAARFAEEEFDLHPPAAAEVAHPPPTGSLIVTRDQLELALRRKRSIAPAKLGDVLVARGLVTTGQVDQALRAQSGEPRRLIGDILVDMGAVDRDAMLRVLCGELGIPIVDVRKFPVERSAANLVARNVAQHYQVLPLFAKGNALVVALADPLSTEVVEMLHFLTDLMVVPVMAQRTALLERIAAEYVPQSAPLFLSAAGADFLPDGAPRSVTESDARSLAMQVLDSPPVLDERAEAVGASDNLVVRLVTQTILEAHQQGVSDIHIETRADEGRALVRFRRDGALVDYLEVPLNACRALLSRIKIMSNLDISERRHPQDGKIAFEQFSNLKMDLRVAIIPTSNGNEDAVLRLLSATRPIGLDKLGLAPRPLEDLRRIASRTFGLILICGPTGSGKTTTLHSVLASINNQETKIWTAEDPIEIRQPGLCQVQVHPKIGFTFAAAMRAFLRADPDVIMVGEMRDQETTRIGIEASLTGHLVLSTLHTNSAAESIVRLLDLGMDPFNFADALLGILSQRLARRLCECKRSRPATDGECELLAMEYAMDDPARAGAALQRWRAAGIRTFEPVGCAKCNQKGYKGRVGLYELLVATPAVKALVQSRGRVVDILETALAEGMTTLRQDGIEKIIEGLTDLRSVKAACD